MEYLLKKIDKMIVFFIIYTISFLVFFKTLKYSLPFVLAFIFSIILKKPTEFLIKKFNLKNSISSFITTLIFFTIIIFSLYFSTTSLIKEGIDLGKNTQIYISNNSKNISVFLRNLEKYYYNLDPAILKTISNNLLTMLSKVSDYTVVITTKLVQITISFLSYIPYIFMLIIFTLISTYFFTKDLTSAKNKFFSIIPIDKSDKISTILNESKKLLVNYAFSYLIIILITFIETLIGFLILRINYALILSIIAAIFDILPILGIGSIYIPLALVNLFIKKDYFTALGLIIWYLIVTIIRQILEPKIVSSSLGMHPVSILAAIFIGLKAAGISGMFFCIFLVVFYKVLHNVKIL
ncbi:sporulation integral membrane protein YtvI [Clostridium cochlearium]|uniref:Sporulation integral membrane protein YtvI n=2 Tax=Clostridium cochlearium TaxID=1494 RepID=A0ABY0QKC6_CLOCO|nr:sporulation integral membrane protein YtvI [Clostridium cochlearium]MBE6065643.1 sporulation integral membrane protein YtvI [Clostridium cochlearium]MCR1972106.1 sporulation integral membrane protein YtvI [Clostridium cochlearium]NMA58319.1 sporulation integral membrane protein YtvI [Clostridium cochlearium]SDL04242.1 sporulation integral membrane protein YtvI [Clostridium cochlearium]SNV90493.1 sporulation integral membrane protein YtvI [Clostridium cochlearium]